ncbi:MAG: leucine-rich repeat domain-containing protein, partial [Dysgonamonadaceae bacterium]|nr:leucine-rich repeat domain-containing protein [Dysgonamonadaceae bacterium]
SLPSVTIPQSVTTIETYAFWGCSSLTHVKVKHTTPPLGIGTNVFDEGTSMTLIVPQNTTLDYQGASVWTDFDEIVEVISFDEQVSVQIAGENTHVYTGSPLKPAVTVKYGQTVLSGNNDYSLAYGNNIRAGQATITITGLLRYEGVKTVSFTIAQATPVVTWPDKAEIEEGQTLSEARFTGGSGEGVFAFVEATATPTLDSNTTFDLTFTPNDAVNYATVKNGMKVTVLPRTTGYSDQLFSGLVIYPNPFFGELHVKGATGCMLRVLNVVGVAVHTQKITTSDEIFQLNNIPAGLYFFRLEKEGKTKTVKVGKR